MILLNVRNMSDQDLFQGWLNGEISRSIRYNHPFSLVILEINLKEEGSFSKDEVFNEFIRMLKYTTRESDVISRFGDVGIMAILPETGKKGGCVFAERIRGLAKDLFDRASITLSAGIASFPEDGKTSSLLYKKACDALQKAKEKGGNEIMVSRDFNIVLIGFMGAGKTKVGTRLAEKLGMGFVDIDDLIETKAGMKISQIFSEFGESYFRDLERKEVEHVSNLTNYVISPGGGAILNKDNMDALRKNGILIYLKASAEVIFERTCHTSHRPLLENVSPYEQIKKLLRYRAPFYEASDYTIDTSNLNIEEVVTKIIEYIKDRKLTCQ
ncbi:MAG: shikimate kinase [bacterium]|nr:shikimate kinase [bacterium]